MREDGTEHQETECVQYERRRTRLSQQPSPFVLFTYTTSTERADTAVAKSGT